MHHPTVQFPSPATIAGPRVAAIAVPHRAASAQLLGLWGVVLIASLLPLSAQAARGTGDAAASLPARSVEASPRPASLERQVARASSPRLLPLLQVVDYVELERYMGTWYEIARNPTAFEAGCVGTTATYTLQADASVEVLNLCYVDSFDGEVREALGSATVADPSTNAKLSVSFASTSRADGVGSPRTREARQGYLAGNYWIIDLGAEYEYAIVGDPSRTYLWFLSRTPTISDALLSQLLESAQASGYDTSKLIYTEQQP